MLLPQSHDSSDNLVTRPRDEQLVFVSWQGKGIILFATASRWPLGPVQLPI